MARVTTAKAARASVVPLKRLLGALSRSGGLLVGLVLLFVALTLFAPHFLTPTNLFNVLRAIALNGMVACAMTFVIISGDIDVSVGSALAWSSALLGSLAITNGWPLWLAVLFVLAQGAAIHSLAALVRVKFNIPSFIVTLTMYMSLRGAAQLITGAWSITPFPAAFGYWGQGYVAKVVPVPAVFMVVTFLLFYFLSTRTVYGRSVYSVGGNVEASRLSGIPVARIRIITYALTGFLSALSGIILSSKINAGSSNIGAGFEFEVIAAVIIGGTSLAGGEGSMVGTLLGVLFIGLLSNGMVLMNVNPFLQDVARGLVILLAVLISEVQKLTRKRRR